MSDYSMSHEVRNLRDAPDGSRRRPPLLGLLVVIAGLVVGMIILQSRNGEDDPTTVLAQGGCFTYSFRAVDRNPPLQLEEVESEVRTLLADEDLGSVHWSGYGMVGRNGYFDNPDADPGYDGRRWVLIFDDPDEDSGLLTSLFGRNGDPRFTVIFDPEERRIDRTCDDAPAS